MTPLPTVQLTANYCFTTWAIWTGSFSFFIWPVLIRESRYPWNCVYILVTLSGLKKLQNVWPNGLEFNCKMIMLGQLDAITFGRIGAPFGLFGPTFWDYFSFSHFTRILSKCLKGRIGKHLGKFWICARFYGWANFGHFKHFFFGRFGITLSKCDSCPRIGQFCYLKTTLV